MMLDFSDVSQMQNFLRRDKHKLLEGMVVEDLFMRDIVFPNNWHHFISNGWWVIKDDSSFILFHITDHAPSFIDKVIYTYFFYLKVPVHRVVLYKNNLYFLEIKENSLTKTFTRVDYMKKNTFLKKNNLFKKRKPLMADEKTRDLFSQERAIEYFKRNGILKEVTLQRYFANYFLSVYYNPGFIINIDSFVICRDGISALEIKFKYPNKSGYYGINSGQSRLFEWLISCGINIYHYIAKNPSYNKDIGIFEVLKTPFLKSKFFWEFAQITKNELSGSNLTAPEETSITGDKKISFKSIDSSKFQMVSSNPIADGIDFSWVPSKRCPYCGHNKVVMIRPNNRYHFECSGFYSYCKIKRGNSNPIFGK